MFTRFAQIPVYCFAGLDRWPILYHQTENCGRMGRVMQLVFVNYGSNFMCLRLSCQWSFFQNRRIAICYLNGARGSTTDSGTLTKEEEQKYTFQIIVWFFVILLSLETIIGNAMVIIAYKIERNISKQVSLFSYTNYSSNKSDVKLRIDQLNQLF